MGTNLIDHQYIANVFHQGVDNLVILGVVDGIRGIASGSYQVHSPANLFQFPNNPRESDLIFDPGRCRLTVPASSLSLSH